MVRSDTTRLLAALRKLLTSAGREKDERICAYLLPGSDAHMSEYLSAWHKRVAFISGFTGSRGSVIVSCASAEQAEKAAMWTDGRYFLQASEEIDQNWTLMKESVEGTPTMDSFLCEVMPVGGVCAVDPALMTANDFCDMQKRLEARGRKLYPLAENLIDAVWAKEGGALFLDECQISEELVQHLNGRLKISGKQNTESNGNLSTNVNADASMADLSRPCVDVHPYDAIKVVLSEMVQHLDKNARRFSHISPIEQMKSIKNATELDGMRKSHIRDAVSHVEFLHWLHVEMHAHGNSNGELTEVSVADKFEALRREHPSLVSLSFPTISAVGGHASKPHYHTCKQTDTPLTVDQCYLVDSGGQYLDGTTDVTRTVQFSATPSEYYRECYTRVLIGHIDLAMQKFPTNVAGVRLDTLARSSLWNVGLDFRHGTGHGVGSYLNVHEGPAGIGYRVSKHFSEGVKPGMVLTIEPGYYEADKFGIRIENVYIVRPAKTRFTMSDSTEYLGFEAVTLVPIETKCIVPQLMRQEHIQWLNEYHANVLETLTVELRNSNKEHLIPWLVEQCKPLGMNILPLVDKMYHDCVNMMAELPSGASHV